MPLHVCERGTLHSSVGRLTDMSCDFHGFSTINSTSCKAARTVGVCREPNWFVLRCFNSSLTHRALNVMLQVHPRCYATDPRGGIPLWLKATLTCITWFIPNNGSWKDTRFTVRPSVCPTPTASIWGKWYKESDWKWKRSLFRPLSIWQNAKCTQIVAEDRDKATVDKENQQDKTRPD